MGVLQSELKAYLKPNTKSAFMKELLRYKNVTDPENIEGFLENTEYETVREIKEDISYQIVEQFFSSLNQSLEDYVGGKYDEAKGKAQRGGWWNLGASIYEMVDKAKTEERGLYYMRDRGNVRFAKAIIKYFNDVNKPRGFVPTDWYLPYEEIVKLNEQGMSVNSKLQELEGMVKIRGVKEKWLRETNR